MLGGADSFFIDAGAAGWWLVLGKTRLLNDSGKEPVQGVGQAMTKAHIPEKQGRDLEQSALSDSERSLCPGDTGHKV